MANKKPVNKEVKVETKKVEPTQKEKVSKLLKKEPVPDTDRVQKKNLTGFAFRINGEAVYTCTHKGEKGFCYWWKFYTLEGINKLKDKEGTKSKT